LKKCFPSAESFEMLSTIAAGLCKWWQAVDFALSASCNDAVSPEDKVVLAINEQMSMGHWWDDTDRGKLKYSG